MAFEKQIRQKGRPRGDNRAPTFTLAKHGNVSINDLAHRLLTDASYVCLHIDDVAGLVGLSRAEPGDKDAYKLTGKAGGTYRFTARGPLHRFAEQYTRPITAVAKFYDRILAAPILPQPAAAADPEPEREAVPA